MLEGTWRWSHPDGSPHVEATFDSGFLAGPLVRRDAAGHKVVEARYAGGRPTLVRRYHQGKPNTEHQGTLQSRACSSPSPRSDPAPPLGSGCQPGLRAGGVAGVVDGSLREFFLDGPAKGKVRNERFFQAGEPAGTWTYRFDDGAMWTRERYQGGKLQGLQESFYTDGGREYQVTMAAGFRDGPWRYWNRQGQLLHQAEYTRGWRRGWRVESYPSGAPRERSHHKPASRPASEVPGGKGRLGFQWKSGLTAYAEDLYGPWVRLREDGTVAELTFHRGKDASTEDPAEYRRWRQNFPGLPAETPGVQLPEPDLRPAVDLSSVSAPPEGLSPSDAHMAMMKLWGAANQASRAGDYPQAERLGLESVRLALAYETEGLRAACIGYDKAIAAATKAGAEERKRSYLNAALALARKLGQANFIQKYQRQLAPD